MRNAACGLLVVAVVLCSGAHSAQEQRKPAVPELLDVVRDGKYGFIDRNGKVVIAPQFAFAFPFSDGMARVRIGKQWSYVNPAGERMQQKAGEPRQFHDADFSEGLAVTRVGGTEQRSPDGYHLLIVGGKYGYIDRRGATAVKIDFDGARPFAEGLAAVKVEDKWGFIDKQGKVMIEPRFDDALEFTGGLARVAVQKKWGLIDRKGTVVVEPRYNRIEEFHGGLAVVVSAGKFGFVDRDGKVTIEPQFDFAGPFADGRARVRVRVGERDRFGYIDRRGKLVIPARYASATGFSEGWAAVRVNSDPFGKGDPSDSKWGYIDVSGQYAIPPTYWAAHPFCEGLAAAAVSDKGVRYGYVDKSGKFVIAPQFDYRAGDFAGGIARVYTDRDFQTKDEHGYIDKMGRFIWKLRGLEK